MCSIFNNDTNNCNLKKKSLSGIRKNSPQVIPLQSIPVFEGKVTLLEFLNELLEELLVGQIGAGLFMTLREFGGEKNSGIIETLHL